MAARTESDVSAVPAPSSATSPPQRGMARLPGGGTAGNELLTVSAGAVLIALLAVIGVTIITLRPLLSVHLFVGMLLIGPLALKLASTGYRFARYYTGNSRYRTAGPPILPLRAIAPIVVLSTLGVFASGVALLFVGPSSREPLLLIHKASFIVWIAFTTLHVLGHLPTLARGLQADYAPAALNLERSPAGRSGRLLALAGAVVAGLTLAIVCIPQFGPWLHFHAH